MCTLRWGIAAAGKISHDFCNALGILPPEQHKVVAVAARDKERAEEFAKKHEIPKAFGSYKQLAECADVDVVYIGALNPQHYELGMLMLEHGKHVLCEKPLCLNRKQVEQLIWCAERNKLFLMEGIWSRFFPAYQYIREQIDSGVLGHVHEVQLTIGNNVAQVDRLRKKELGGGVTLDFGVYAIQFAQWIFEEPPEKIVAEGELNSEGVDMYVKSELHYPHGGVAKFVLSGYGLMDNTAVIKGTKGQITVPKFSSPTKLIEINGKEKEWVLPKGKFSTNFKNTEGLCYEAEAVRQHILEGKLQCETILHVESLLIAYIEDEIRKQVGAVLPEDEEKHT